MLRPTLVPQRDVAEPIVWMADRTEMACCSAGDSDSSAAYMLDQMAPPREGMSIARRVP